jgi:hypothetical protein
MLRVGQKRRRTHNEKLADEAEAKAKEEAINDKLARLDELELKNQELQAKAEEHQAAADILNDLASKQKIVIQRNGEVKVPGFDDIDNEQV